MFKKLVVLWMLLFPMAPAVAQVSVNIGFYNEDIGINLSLYPELVPVPGYPVYYAPRLNSNYFFYDGMYWVYQRDSWFASFWYNGPWQMVNPEAVPVYILRVPVRYYRQPPAYFSGWLMNAPPRWDEHWGNDWAQRRRGWEHWDRKSTPAPAPLPVYQRKYSGDRYPAAEQQQALQNRNYRYQPHDPEVRQHYQALREQRAPVSPQRSTQRVPQVRNAAPQVNQRANPPASAQPGAPMVPMVPHAAPHAQPPQKAGENMERPVPPQAPQQRRGPPVQQQSQQPLHEAVQHPQSEPKQRSEEKRSQGNRAAPEIERDRAPGQERDRDREKADERGQDRRR